MFSNSALGDSLTNKFVELFHDRGGVFAIKIHEGNTTEVIEYALQELNLPSALGGFLNNLLQEYISFESVNEMTLGEAFSPIISHYIFVVASFILIFILIRIACNLLNKLFKTLEQIPLIKVVNRTIGGLLGGIVGILLICLISFGITFIIPLDTSFSNFLIDTLRLENPDVMTLSKYIYQENFLLVIITFIQNLFV